MFTDFDRRELLSSESFIQEGTAPTEELLLAVCTVGDDYDDPDNEVVLITPENVLRFGFMGESLVSIDHNQNGEAFVVGENGSVILFRWSGVSTVDEFKATRTLLLNEMAAETGPIRRIRSLGGVPVCVGSFGQVYQVSAQGIDELPFLDIYPEDVTIKDIAGTSTNSMVAVTQHGVAARFDGSDWIDLDLPTNKTLSSIAMRPDGTFAIAGSGANVFVGSGENWSQYRFDDRARDYYGVAWQGQDLYAAHLGGVDRLIDGQLSEINYDTEVDLEFAFIRSGSESVWSFSGGTIGRVSNGSWTTIFHRAT